MLRRCSKSPCDQTAAYTLTYVYAEKMAVVGPLATRVEPHAYDLCARHAERMSVPRGWEVLRMELPVEDRGPSDDDLVALAEAVREAARPLVRHDRAAAVTATGEQQTPGQTAPHEGTTRRGHLRALPREPGE